MPRSPPSAIPKTPRAELLERWCAAGVNRVSFGVQSMVPHVLDGLGRRHDPDGVARAVTAAGAAGIGSVSVDVIFGGAGESDDDWARTLEGVLALDPRPTHVSAYALTVEPGTPLAADPARHPDDDVLATRYEMADDALGSAGYRWYEVSNWAVPGHECRHNQLYWRQGDYRGIGCAAHSHSNGRRWWNVRTPERYIASVESYGDSPRGPGPLSSAEELTQEQSELRRPRLGAAHVGGSPRVGGARRHLRRRPGTTARRPGRLDVARPAARQRGDGATCVSPLSSPHERRRRSR